MTWTVLASTAAWSDAMAEARGPRMPAESQVGALPGAGLVGFLLATALWNRALMRGRLRGEDRPRAARG